MELIIKYLPLLISDEAIEDTTGIDDWYMHWY